MYTNNKTSALSLWAGVLEPPFQPMNLSDWKQLTNQRPWNSLVEHPFRWMSEDVRLKVQSHLEISLTLDVWYAVCALCDLHANDGDDTQLSRYNHECLPQDVMLVPSQFDRFLSSTDQSVKGYRNIHDYQKWPLRPTAKDILMCMVNLVISPLAWSVRT